MESVEIASPFETPSAAQTPEEKQESQRKKLKSARTGTSAMSDFSNVLDAIRRYGAIKTVDEAKKHLQHTLAFVAILASVLALEVQELNLADAKRAHVQISGLAHLVELACEVSSGASRFAGGGA